MSKARLTALRLVGFKSFAERTVIEFGPGISAVVGPNGSGKSNLADALRWTLGEQGRSLRTRRAEDLIFAGSSSRRAIGMADVTIVIDNEDRLLPVDFGEVEIGRRLYRSGENEYLLNRQRLRLRDLVEMLDAGNLADNAFLFIGQGMVDQALALRPEERRPLFEEAAGVRRHERRRRQAEADLAEAETNLERLRDLLGELRPQARRLAAQAEQLEARRTAGLELAEALLAAARARWTATDETENRESAALTGARSAADAALADLRTAEEIAERTSREMASHAEQERARRATLDAQRAHLSALRVTEARLGSETEAVDREAARVTSERDAAEGRLRDAALASSAAAPQSDPALAAELESVERALGELRPLADGGADAGTATAAAERALAARRNESEQHLRLATDAASAAATAQAQLERLDGRLSEAEAERDAAVTELAKAAADEAAAQAAVDNVRETARAAAAELNAASERAHALEIDGAGARASLSALEAALQSAVDEDLARAARARGGKLVAEGLEIESQFQAAVSAALGEVALAFAVDDAAPLVKVRRIGTLVVRPHGEKRVSPSAGSTAAIAQLAKAAQSLGGGRLADCIRRDPFGEVTRLLERVIWLPDIVAALKVAPSLPAGWRAVTLAGDVVTDEGVIRLASERSILEQQQERDNLIRRVAALDERTDAETSALQAARDRAARATAAAATAQAPLDDARAARSAAEDRERLAQRRAEQWLREVTWERSRVERLTKEAASAGQLAERSAAELAHLQRRAAEPARRGPRDDRRAQEADLEAQRAQLVRAKADEDARLSAWNDERRVADVKRTIDEGRLAELDNALRQLSPRRAELSRQQIEIATRLAEAEVAEAEATRQLEAVLAAGADDRSRLIQTERAAAEARERLRVAEQQSRRSEVAQMEARLQLEQIREGLLVELAGIGRDGLIALAASTRSVVEADPDNTSDAFEKALGAVIEQWRTAGGEMSEAPTASRLGSLRRRFHDLGAGNPFAAEEYVELRERLDGMEAQRLDLESAIASTHELISSLNALITDQFRRTFAALEDAFARRFHELFGGGDAELSLTAPEDLSATGVEIHARPPGKKRQPLSMLSGGERALTAVSLLLAMLEVRPVPFCVLDEVDAALDEANIGRFSKALRGLAEQTQFIVITHNRGTIEAADALYGVTIGDDAVSRVVSLRLPKPATNGKKSAEVLAEAVDAEVVEPAEAALA